MKKKIKTLYWEWVQRAKEGDQTCAKCGRVGLMTLDHIVPQQIIDGLGLIQESYNDDWNFQYLCRACNTLKSYKMDFNNPKTFENLKKYITKAEEFYSS